MGGGGEQLCAAAGGAGQAGAGYTREHLTLSLTPVLCDQLEAPGALERCVAFLREVRPETHRLDAEGFRQAAQAAAVAELERSAAAYAHAAETLQRLARDPGGLAAALGAHATWTSSATHAILPLLALRQSVDLQLEVGIDSYRKRSGEWGGGFWLPECAYAPWLDGPLADAGIHLTCVELTQTLGRGGTANLQPLPHARRPDGGVRSTAPRSISSGAPGATRRARPTATPTARPGTTTTSGPTTVPSMTTTVPSRKPKATPASSSRL